MSTHPRARMVPRVSCDTTRFTGRCVPIPTTGTMSTGVSGVSELPTRGISVRNPGNDFSEMLTWVKFKELNMDLFRITMKPVEHVFKAEHGYY
jgi:hypothetical protein